jgi:hypothetical protein
MPLDLAKAIHTIDLIVTDDDQFVFMGRPITIGKGNTPGQKADAVRSFLLDLVDEERLDELMKLIQQGDL